MQTINPVLQGMMQGAAVAQMIRRAAMEREMFERDKARRDREDEMADLKTRMMLGSAARPLEAGTVARPLEADLPEPDPMNPGGLRTRRTTTTVREKADPSRVVKYRGRDGQTHEYELKTEEEQAGEEMARRLKEARAAGELRMGLALEEIRGKQALGETPGRIAAANRDSAEARAEAQRTFAGEQARLGRKAAKKRQRAQMEFQAGENRKNRQAQRDIVEARAGAALARDTAKSEGAGRRAIDSQVQGLKAEAAGLQKKHDALQDEEHKVYAERRKIEELLEGKLDDKEKLKQRAEYTRLNSRLAYLRAQKAATLKRKEETQAKHLALERGAGGAGAEGAVSVDDLFARYKIIR